MSNLTFKEVSETNKLRCNRWHGVGWADPLGPVGAVEPGAIVWSGADWSNAMQSEAGEAGNVVKKLRRIDGGLWGNRKEGDLDRESLIAKLASEIADTYAYLDLLATYYGIDIESAIVTKFNAISVAAGFPERL